MGRTLFLKAAGVLLFAVALHSTNARAANFSVSTDPKETCSAIDIQGEFRPGDYERFVVALKEATARAPLRRLYLNSGGGNLATALAVVDLIRNAAPTVDTIVQSRQRCNSACVIVLTVGSRHNVSAEAELIIHQAFNEVTGERDAALTKKLGQYLAMNGMPPDVIWTMSNLKSDELLAITPSNAKRLGFGSFSFYGSTDPPATPHCSWEGFIVNGP